MSKGNKIRIIAFSSLLSNRKWTGRALLLCLAVAAPTPSLGRASSPLPFEPLCRGTQHHEAGRHHHLQRSVNRNNSNWHVSNRKVQRPCRRPSALRLAPPPSPTSRDLLHHVFLRKRERFDIYFYELCGYDAVPFSATYVLWCCVRCLERERYTVCTICTIHTYLSYL